MAKLVRDKIPEIIAREGSVPATHVASQSEYEDALRMKLREEVSEYLESRDPQELVDIVEVAYALAALHDVTQPQLETFRETKVKEKGAFSKRTILE